MVDNILSRLACGGVTVLAVDFSDVFVGSWYCVGVAVAGCFCSVVVAFWYVFVVPLRPDCKREVCCFADVVDVVCLFWL